MRSFINFVVAITMTVICIGASVAFYKVSTVLIHFPARLASDHTILVMCGWSFRIASIACACPAPLFWWRKEREEQPQQSGFVTY